jgi:hypothetical protein
VLFNAWRNSSSLSHPNVCLLCVSACDEDANDISVVIREYDVPTPNSRPHDPEVASDAARFDFRRHSLVQRIWCEAKYSCGFQSKNEIVLFVARPLGRRCGAQHGRYAR